MRHFHIQSVECKASEEGHFIASLFSQNWLLVFLSNYVGKSFFLLAYIYDILGLAIIGEVAIVIIGNTCANQRFLYIVEFFPSSR